ncbi:MAG: hypothetical protein H6828_06570 [Planctomycetes bacterium]|nr:hypothetical protein [Planctomycetota bacterium]
MSSTGPSASPAEPLRQARQVGETLRAALTELLAATPRAPRRPGELAKALGVNRATASKLLGALAKPSPLEVLHVVPGPEPLRRVARGAEALGAPSAATERVERAVSDFDRLIRKSAGNRAALDALVTANLPGARERFELASKYSVYKGLSQLKGVQAEQWVGCAVVVPAADDPERHDLTWLNGAVALQRLRPGVDVRFSFRARRAEHGGDAQEDLLPALSVLPLEAFCVNPPARLEARVAGDAIHYTLPDDLLGPEQVVDMFVVDHHPAAIARFNSQPEPRRTSLVVEPAVPVANLVFDVLLHDDVFPGAAPELYVYDTSYLGLANVNDASRDLDRVPLRETVQVLGRGLAGLEAEGLPTYAPMLTHLADRMGWDTTRLRGFRTRVAYPVYGWQVCLAFERPRAR